eukprot:TRINITY_DN2971_c0_g1_i4.p1 TRINITY_DN2971_c0_g1~~TRINITY_DN2971_c0_g1_i4.p1  ORF type:complete len:203 (-),score=33.10 TRINITY_DN2971_c0_g1_i4:58-666(-)
MSSIGYGERLGIHPKSSWNNPEPELVLVVNRWGKIVGCTLGNDVNLRDFEGRSALLLGKAKDNNGSTVIGPMIRLFDDSFTLEDAKKLEIKLTVKGKDNFISEGTVYMNQIGRDIEELVAQTINKTHQYPDGLFLFCGTMFAPVEDRDPVNKPGGGFTHLIGDEVLISNPFLGSLYNTVDMSDKIPEWSFGVVDYINRMKVK